MSLAGGGQCLVSRWGLLTLLLSVGVSACEKAAGPVTQIVVVVDSDLGVPDVLDGLKISVTGTVKSSMVEAALDAQHPLPRSLGVVHSGGPLGPVRVSATGTHEGAVVVERVADVYFEKDRTLKLALPLMHACVRADSCDSDQTCDQGTCISSALGDLPQFKGDDGPFLDGGLWVDPGPETDAGRQDSGPGELDAGLDAAADSGHDQTIQQPTVLISCNIEQPQADKVFYLGDEIAFKGSCNDPKTGELPVRWRSSLDGMLSQRGAFTKNDLSVGAHEISLCAAGSSSTCASKRTIQVQEVPDMRAQIISLAQAGKIDGVYSGDAELVAKGTGVGVPPLKFRWVDSFAGELGSGDTAHYGAPMPAGRHIVRLVVTDARGRSAQAERIFVVHEAAYDALFETYAMLTTVFNGDMINALTSDSGYHYVGTEKGGVLGISAEDPPQTTGAYLGMSSPGSGSVSPSVRDVFVRAGKAYLATSSGVQICDVKGDKVSACAVQTLSGLSGSSIPRSARVVTGSDGDYLVVGTSLGLWTGGVKALDKGGMRENNTVFSGLTESAGNLWIAASAGLYNYALAGALLGSPTKIDSGPSGLTALVSSGDVIWASLSEGIAAYDAGDKHWTTWTTNYDTATFGRLVSNDVRTVAITHPVIEGVAHDVIWIGTGSGLSRFDPAIPSFTTYTKADGLPDNAVVRAFGLPSNELLLATQSGLAIHRGQ